MYILNMQLPRWIAIYLSSLGFLFKYRWSLLVLSIVVSLGVASVVTAMCDTIPERVASLCSRLGYETDDCDLRFEKRNRIQGVLEITVDDWISEPDVEPLVPGARATAVRLKTKSAEAVQIYQGADARNAEQLGLAWAIQQSPCAFLTCVRKREKDPDHQGLTEEEVTDLATVANHILFQTGDADQIEDFRRAYNSIGIPTITWVEWDEAEVIDRVGTKLASVLRVPVIVYFALPPQFPLSQD